MSGHAHVRVTAGTCSRCAGALVQEVASVAGIVDVALDRASGVLTIGYTAPPDPAALRAAIDDAGYVLRPV